MKSSLKTILSGQKEIIGIYKSQQELAKDEEISQDTRNSITFILENQQMDQEVILQQLENVVKLEKNIKP